MIVFRTKFCANLMSMAVFPIYLGTFLLPISNIIAHTYEYTYKVYTFKMLVMNTSIFSW